MVKPSTSFIGQVPFIISKRRCQVAIEQNVRPASVVHEAAPNAMAVPNVEETTNDRLRSRSSSKEGRYECISLRRLLRAFRLSFATLSRCTGFGDGLLATFLRKKLIDCKQAPYYGCDACDDCKYIPCGMSPPEAQDAIRPVATIREREQMQNRFRSGISAEQIWMRERLGPVAGADLKGFSCEIRCGGRLGAGSDWSLCVIALL